MPELPDLAAYIAAITRYLAGQRLRRVEVFSPFVLRSVHPPLDSLPGATLIDVFRIGKRLALVFEPSSPAEAQEPLCLVIHLMIAGRLRWRESGRKAPAGRRIVLAALEFDRGTLYFTEAGSKKRASMQLVAGLAAARALDPGGIEPLEATLTGFRDALTRENHTVKRALTDPRLFSGIGNAYSDEILHAARLSPLTLTRSLSDEEIVRLYDAVRGTLALWIDRLQKESAGGFPEKVTAFRSGMAVHGRFRQPCPVCGRPVQRIVYADNECNYCAACQAGGRLLADRALSRLLKQDRPRTLDD
jgi:formamidopyrimidine-DNA glycosylase